MATSTFGIRSKSSFIVTSTLLYGVFVTRKSFCLGLRYLEKREHANMLAMKVSGHILPQELVDLIADKLYALEKATVQAQWKDESIGDENLFKFDNGLFRQTPAAVAVRAKIKSMGIKYTQIVNDMPTPYYHDGDNAQHASVFFHLCASKRRPELAIIIPPGPVGPVFITRPIRYSKSTGLTLVNTCTGVGGIESLPTFDMAHHMRNPQGGATRHVTTRLLQCDGVEEAMRNWDAEAIRRLVDLMELCPVPHDHGDELKPGLHVSQKLYDNE